MRPIGIITALADETAALRGLDGRDGYVLRQSGPGPERAAAAARGLLETGCGALISAGICGGLRNGLAPGTLVLAHRVRDAAGNGWTVDRAWRAALAEHLGGRLSMASGVLLGSDRVLATPREKAEAGRIHDAMAVDMESHAVAAVAAEAGLPFLVLRAVSDPARTHIPRVAFRGVDRAGNRRPGRVAKGLLKHPGDLPDLVRLAFNTGRATRTLGRAVTFGARIRFGLGQD